MNVEEDPRPLMVSIRCITYNQERYIRDALEGFVMQKTNFRFEAVVHDDASTDGTADIIREYAEKYPDIIKPIYEIENQYSKHDGSLTRIMDEACTGKYFALCEGDDYWIDPMKLQKQVDVMEAHPEFSMCWTDAFQEHDVERTPYNRYSESCISPMKDLIEEGGSFVPTCSMLVRNDIYKSMPQEAKGWYIGDYPLQMWCGWKGKCWYISEQTCVYRVMAVGSWSEKFAKQRDPDINLWLYRNDSPMMETFNKLTEYKYNESFERYAIANYYNTLLHATDGLKEIKPYYKLRKKYGFHTGKAETLIVYGYPRLAKVVILGYTLKGILCRLLTWVKS